MYMEDDKIENIHSFIYLGAKSQSDGDSRADVKHRMVIPQEASSSLYHLWNNSHLPLSRLQGSCMPNSISWV